MRTAPFPAAARRPLAAGLALAALAAAHSARAADEDDDDPKPVPAAEVIEKLRPHAVRVLVFSRRDDGLVPEGGAFARDMMNERPTMLAGYWWDAEGRVVMRDPVLPAPFVRRIELAFADGTGGARTVPAEVVGLHPTARLWLLKPAAALPDGVTPVPLAFAAPPERTQWGKMRTFVYEYARDIEDWRAYVAGGPERLARNDADGKETLANGVFDEGGVLVDALGRAVGLASLNPLPADSAQSPWWGRDIKAEDFLSAEALARQEAGQRERLARAALEVRLHFRQQVEDDENRGNRYRGNYDRQNAEMVNDNAVEHRATGLRIGDRRLLVPVGLSRDLIAKLEDITVVLPGGERRAGHYAGALRHFHAVYVDVEGDAPPGEALFAVGQPPRRALRHGEYFLRPRITHHAGQRKERYDYDRVLGLHPQYRNMPALGTQTNEQPGDLAVGADGEVLAVALALRVAAADQPYYLETNAAFRPVPALARALALPDAIDETLVPKAKEEERRLVAFGVEAQGLNHNLAKWFGAEAATRGGQIGMLVTYVYPDGPAAKLGLREHDILLRLTPPNRTQPVDLGGGSAMPWYNLVASDSDAIRNAERGAGFLPPPWPSPENRLTTLLTSYGPGREVTLEYVRDGQVARAKFTTEMAPPDFQSAPKHRSRPLGMTVKEVTYEVARFFKRAADAGGVVVAHVELGEKAQVAGLGPYMLVTRVDGAPVAGLDDFRDKIAAVEKGERKAVEFTLEMMGKTRLAKIEFGG